MKKEYNFLKELLSAHQVNNLSFSPRLIFSEIRFDIFFILIS
jgi:hypothetical protein